MNLRTPFAGALFALALAAAPASAQTLDGRTLVLTGTADADTMTLAIGGGKVTVDDAFSVSRAKFDRIRVDLGEGLDTLALSGGRFEATADGDHVRLTRNGLELDLDGTDIVRLDDVNALTVDDLSATDTFQVDAGLGAGVDKVTVNGSEDDDQISFGSFGVLGPTFVTLRDAEPTDRLAIDGRGGDDILSASAASLALTLVGGSGDNVLRGGPGDDVLIGGDGFDDAVGGPGHDSAKLGGDFDRFSWKPGDGSDEVDGGDARDSVFLEGSNAPEAFAVKADRNGLRLTRDLDVLALKDLEEVDAVAGGGADTFAIGDLRRTPAELVDISLASLPITPGGDGQPDRVTVDATPGRDTLTLTGTKTTATLDGLSARVNISHAEAADTLTVDTRGGRDTIDTGAFDPATIGVRILE